MSEDEWYWLQAGESRGPAARAALEKLLQSGEVRPDTLIWRLGQDRWKSIAEIWPDIARRAPQPSPLPMAPSDVDRQPSRGGEWLASSPRPWRRYFARLLDITVSGAITFFAIGIAFAFIDPNASERFFSSVGSNRIVDTMLTVAAGIPLNALLIGLTGGSLGKWLFGVRILDPQRAPIGFPAALSREGAVWFRGLALGIPLVSLLTMIFAWRTLTANGATSWDSTRSIVVVYRPMGTGQVMGAMAGVLTLLGAVAGLAVLGV